MRRRVRLGSGSPGRKRTADCKADTMLPTPRLPGITRFFCDMSEDGDREDPGCSAAKDTTGIRTPGTAGRELQAVVVETIDDGASLEERAGSLAGMPLRNST